MSSSGPWWLMLKTMFRCTGATWSDAVVIYPGEALALVNIERQVLPSAPRLPRVWYRLPADPPIS